MAQIPDHDYTVSELEEQKTYACTYVFMRRNESGKFVGTKHINAKNMGEALVEIDSYCANNVDYVMTWDYYNVKAIVEID